MNLGFSTTCYLYQTREDGSPDSFERSEALLVIDPSFEGSVILFDDSVQVGAITVHIDDAQARMIPQPRRC